MDGKRLAYITWWFKIGARFMQVAPVITPVVVFLSLFSQLALLASLLLPLKVVVLLGSNESSRFVFGPLKVFPHETLVLSLTFAALVFYALHLVSKNIIAKLSLSGSSKLLDRTSKLVLFENQDEIISRAFEKYASGFAQILFSFAGVFLLSFIYPDLAVLLASYVVIVGFLLAILSCLYSPIRTLLTSQFQATVRLLGVVSFLALFGYIVVDFLWLTPPDFWKAIVGLILGRQVCMQAAGGLCAAKALGNKKEKINALLFHCAVFLSQTGSNKPNVWDLLAQATIRNWVYQTLPEQAGFGPSDLEVSWLQAKRKGVLNLIVKTRFGQCFLVKVADQGSGALLLHERSLLLNGVQNLPAPALVGSTQVQGFHCNVLDISGCVFLTDDTLLNKRDLKEQFLLQRLHYLPDPDLVEQFLRTKPTVLDRVGMDCFFRLHLVANSEDKVMVNTASKIWPMILHKLKGLPLRVADHSAFSLRHIVLDKAGKPIEIDWGGWTLEPAGAGWPVDESQEMEDALYHWGREYLPDLDPSLCVMAAWLWLLEAHYDSENYGDAIKSLNKITSLWQAMS